MKPAEPIPLENAWVRLRPIGPEDAADLLTIGADPAVWSFLAGEHFRSVLDAEAWIAGMLSRPEYAVTYAVIDRVSCRVAGSTSILGLQTRHASAEIGSTWYGTAFQRTHVNTATKLALFSYLFDELGARRVQLQTDARNKASQRAIERVGGVKEGVLRQHKTYPNGFVRDSVIYSVVSTEWPAVRVELTHLLESRG